MKKIIGLDLGTTSIGWAVVNEAENENEQASIVKLGVRVNPLTVDEQANFEAGKAITTNADRTLKRSMRRSLQRYKLRRANLIDCLKEHNIINDATVLCEDGNASTFETYRLRAKAATERIELSDFARVLLMINKKRGYKSNRKANTGEEEGQPIDGMDVAKKLYENNLTPGEYTLELLNDNKKYTPAFYRSDLVAELDAVWNKQKEYYPELLTDDLREAITDKSKKAVNAIFHERTGKYAIDNKATDKKLQAYTWRVAALHEQLDIEVLIFVIAEISSAIAGASGYLGAIGDRSKELAFGNLTIGQYLMNIIAANPNDRIKGRTFYRTDYLNEFERIWEVQAQYHPQLTPTLKKEIRDIVIFYQRQLKSKKFMLAKCEFESREIKTIVDGKEVVRTIGPNVCPKSSPIFQEFKVWQILNNLKLTNTATNSEEEITIEEKEKLYWELMVCPNKGKEKKKSEILSILGKKKNYDLNYDKVECNQTTSVFFKACRNICIMTGHDAIEEFGKKREARKIIQDIRDIFDELGFDNSFLQFDSAAEKLDNEPMYKLWHLLYSYEGDKSLSGNEKLIEKLMAMTNIPREYIGELTTIGFKDDYGNLSACAMRKLLPYMHQGMRYDEACEKAYGTHSKASLTNEQLDAKEYVNRLELLPRNSLRNPVVEKILNQTIHVVNGLMSDYGRPDEIRIELARELKKSAEERESMTKAISDGEKANETLRKEIMKKFNFTHVSKNDIIRYKLYLELKENGYKTLYSNTYIPEEKIFSKDFDIEHIIPQARLFDDSLSNKTLEARQVNIDKGKSTAYDFVLSKYGAEAAKEYKNRIDALLKANAISKSKHDKLLMREADIPSDFIDRDLRNTQYIAKKAREILLQCCRTVTATTGSITDRLREDWQLINVMRDLNWDKYEALGMTESFTNRDGQVIKRIKNWTKRNDHRHHAMDALTIAFTKPAIIQYLNNLNARSDKAGSIYGIEQNELYRNDNGKLTFRPPMPLDEFRAEAKRQLENILISIKAKNKVTTNNVNKTKRKDGKFNKTIQQTPRGQLHKETIYGHINKIVANEVKVGSNMDANAIAFVAKKVYREALLKRLEEFGGDPKKAFTGKNSLEKNPIWLNADHTFAVPLKVKLVSTVDVYPVRKEINKDLNVDKVIDKGIQRILKARLEEFGNDANKAFANLDENPIWLNKEKGICIKSVKVSGISTAVALHSKHDKFGAEILDENGNSIEADFVETKGNHHCAIFRDEKGNLQEHMVSFFEATTRAQQGLPIIDKSYNSDLGWKFEFTMKQNEYFVLPTEDFNPADYDLTDESNYALISPHLYRVQKMSSCYYCFRHHLETTVEDNKDLKGFAWERITSLAKLNGIVKVRVNHLGKIVDVGEY